MSFGWSSGDIISLAKLCWDVYNFIHTVPAELQSVFCRLDRIGRKLERLVTILEKSGKGTCEEIPSLKQHLLDAKVSLEPLRNVTNKAASIPPKAKGLARLSLSQDKLRCIERNLDEDDRAIDDIKGEIIL